MEAEQLCEQREALLARFLFDGGRGEIPGELLSLESRITELVDRLTSLPLDSLQLRMTTFMRSS